MALICGYNKSVGISVYTWNGVWIGGRMDLGVENFEDTPPLEMLGSSVHGQVDGFDLDGVFLDLRMENWAIGLA